MKSTSKCPFIKEALFKIYLPQNDALSWIVNALPISHHQMPFNAVSYWIFVWYDCEGHALSNNPRLFHRACPSCFSTMPFKCPSMPFQIAFLYDIILRGMPFQMPFQIDVKLFERAFGRACPSTFYHTKGQFERALKGIWLYDIRRAFTI